LKISMLHTPAGPLVLESAAPLEALLVSVGIVAIGEIGDKTQVATVALAARYDAPATVVLGTTFGMLAANVPVVLLA
jgi:putative Ca2+/H+ antiporter (TMEM165/GDT1 family)